MCALLLENRGPHEVSGSRKVVMEIYARTFQIQCFWVPQKKREREREWHVIWAPSEHYLLTRVVLGGGAREGTSRNLQQGIITSPINILKKARTGTMAQTQHQDKEKKRRGQEASVEFKHSQQFGIERMQ